jgi:hypothetical protein
MFLNYFNLYAIKPYNFFVLPYLITELLFPRTYVIFTPEDTLEGSSKASAIEKDFPENIGLSNVANLEFFI